MSEYEVSVVAPCFNEAGNLPELVSRLVKAMKRKNISLEIVLVNDASTDATGNVIDRLATEYDCLVPVHHQNNQGIEGGWRSGVSAASGKYVCLMDADLQNLPEDVPRLYRELKHTGADVVQGYRSTVGRLKDSRYTLSKGLNTILNLTFKMNLKDNKSGFLIASRDTMADILRHHYKYDYFQTFIMVSAAAKGYRIHEIETLFESRLAGESFLPRVPVTTIGKVLGDVAKGFVEFRAQVKKENILSDFIAQNPPLRSDAPLTGWRKASFDAYSWTMPLHKWMITRRARSYYDELKQSQWLSPDKVRELQEVKLRRLVEHSYQHVAYYRERMDAAGLKPSDIRTLDDLKKLPFLEKKDVRENLYFDLMSDNHDKKRILKISTSGSTGEPFVCYADQHQLEIRWASTLRSMEWTGYRWGDKQARLWHQTLGMSKLQHLRERIDALFSRRMFIPAYEMTQDNLGAVIEKLRKYDPKLVDGYAESFNLLATYLKQNNISGFDLRGIVSSAQVLPDNVRDVIEHNFECGVFDKYGAREFSGIAYECAAHAGHHVCAESYIVEILAENGQPAKPGEMGEVVITDLNNFCTPFIRYRIGDLAVAMDNTEQCKCGRGLPRIGKIEGRVQAIIFAKDGTFLPGTFFAHLFKDYDHLIRQYQVIQEEYGEVEIKVIKGPRYTDEGFEEVRRELRKFLGSETIIRINFVDEIPMVRTGKQQGSISRLNVDFQEVGGARRGDTKDHDLN